MIDEAHRRDRPSSGSKRRSRASSAEYRRSPARFSQDGSNLSSHSTDQSRSSSQQSTKKEMLKYMIHEVRELRKQLDPSYGSDEKVKSSGSGSSRSSGHKRTKASHDDVTQARGHDDAKIPKQENENLIGQKHKLQTQASVDSSGRKRRLLPAAPVCQPTSLRHTYPSRFLYPTVKEKRKPTAKEYEMIKRLK